MKIREYIQVKPYSDGGGENPDPAVYCPANGYIPDPEVLHPPVPLPESTPQSIICICNASIGGWKALTHKYNLIKTGSDPYLYELFDSNGDLIDSWTSAVQAIDFDFPTNVGYYTVKISLPSPSFFRGFYNSEGGILYYNNSIEAIIFNTPNLSQFSPKGNINFKNVEWANAESFEALTGFANAFVGCTSLQYFKFPQASALGFTTFYNVFPYSGLRKIDLSNIYMQNIDLSDNIFSNCKYLDEIIMPDTWYGNRNYWLFRNTIRLRKLVLPTTWSPSGTPSTSFNYVLDGSGVEGELEFPSMPYVNNIGNFASNCPNLQILRFKGDWSGLEYTTNLITNSPSLHTLELPRILNSTAFVQSPFSTTDTGLRYVILPDIGFCGVPLTAGLISITGECDNSGFSTQSSILMNTAFRTTLQVFNCPKLRLQRLQLGTSSSIKFTVLNSMEIDWANSDWSHATGPQIQISANFDATELNRIMTALPVVSGKFIDIFWNPGFMSANINIAKAKGWNVHNIPVVSTNAVTNIARTSATCGGNVTESVGATVSTKGCCWSTSPNPTTANSKTSQGTGAGTFISSLTGLTANTTYYLRAYATNTYGTAYGDQQSFTTLP